MSKITKLQEKRVRVWKQAKDFLDAKQKENDVLSAEDNATYEQMEKEVIDLGKEIDRLHKQIEIEAELNQPTSRALTYTPSAGSDVKSADIYVDTFWQMMRGKGAINALKEGF